MFSTYSLIFLIQLLHLNKKHSVFLICLHCFHDIAFCWFFSLSPDSILYPDVQTPVLSLNSSLDLITCAGLSPLRTFWLPLPWLLPCAVCRWLSTLCLQHSISLTVSGDSRTFSLGWSSTAESSQYITGPWSSEIKCELYGELEINMSIWFRKHCKQLQGD